MIKDEWKSLITDACKAAGTYRSFFDAVIDTLAGIMETRDEAAAQYEASGGNPVVVHTNKGGNANIVKNPVLVALNDLNQSALAYWRDLGLTPAGLRRINEDAVKGKPKQATLGSVLKDLGI